MVNTVQSLVMPDGEEFEFIGKTYYGKCYTNANSSTKFVNIPELDPNSLVDGIVIYVRFAYKNRISSPSLQVNNGSAIPIRFRDERDYDNPTYGLPSYYWSDGDVISFIYTNNYWVIFDSHQYYYGVCNTAASNTEKTVTIPGFDNDSFKYGTLVFINFKYGNTANNVRATIANTTVSAYLYKSGTSFDGTNTDIIGIGNFSPGIKAFICEIEQLSNGTVDRRLMSVMDPNVPTVSVVRNLTGGTKIGTITVNGTGTDLYAPTPPVQSVNGQTGAVTITDSDEKLKTSAVSETSVYYLIFGSASDIASTKFYDTNLKYQSATDATLTLGSLNGKTGGWQIFNGGYFISLLPSTLTARRTIYLPDKAGTVALISDIPTVPSNVSSFSNDAGYITLADLPIYDGTVETNARGQSF